MIEAHLHLSLYIFVTYLTYLGHMKTSNNNQNDDN
jgi:hypothetical protein